MGRNVLQTITIAAGLFFVVLAGNQCRAQDSPDTSLVDSVRVRPEIRRYGAVGVAQLDLDELNAKLELSGYTAFDTDVLSFGGGWMKIKSRGIGIGEYQIQLLMDDGGTRPNYRSKFGAGSCSINGGVIAIKTRGLNVYPLLGVGGYVMTLGISPTEEYPFDDVLDNPERSMSVSFWGAFIQASLGVDYRFDMTERKYGTGGLVIGLHGGYRQSIIDLGIMSDIEIADPPDVGVTGPFVALIVGWGGHVEK